MANNQYCFRIYTVDLRREDIATILRAHGVTGFTMFTGIGYWLGAKDISLTIEVIGGLELREILREACASIANMNNQEAVYFTSWQIEASLLFTEKVNSEVRPI